MATPQRHADRRAHRHRRRFARRVHGPRGAARRAAAGDARVTGRRGRRPRQPERTGQPGAAARERLSPPAEVATGIALVHDAVLAELRAAHLPILLGGDHSLGDRLDQRGRASLPRTREKTARAVARCARRFQHQRSSRRAATCTACRSPCLCGFGPAELTGMSGACPALDAHSIRQIGIRSVDQGEKRFVHESGSKSSTCATSTRWACAHTLAARARRPRRGDAPACELRRRLPRSRTSRRASTPTCRAGRPTAKRSSAWK